MMLPWPTRLGAPPGRPSPLSPPSCRVHPQPSSRKPRTRELNSFGLSMNTRCPALSMTTHLALGMRSARSVAFSAGTTLSSSPAMTRVGHGQLLGHVAAHRCPQNVRLLDAQRREQSRCVLGIASVSRPSRGRSYTQGRHFPSSAGRQDPAKPDAWLGAGALAGRTARAAVLSHAAREGGIWYKESLRFA